MKRILYRFWQCTWGIFQTILGFILFLKYFKFEGKHSTATILHLSNDPFSIISNSLSINGRFSTRILPPSVLRARPYPSIPHTPSHAAAPFFQAPIP